MDLQDGSGDCGIDGPGHEPVVGSTATRFDLGAILSAPPIQGGQSQPQGGSAMAHYLPMLLASVSTHAPDDNSMVVLPRGQVDYLSHEWTEEDVWRSWRNMTRQKNEIANGVRLENASWRTWWKQRNKLKTVTPETLNWCVFSPFFPSVFA
jgi:hypothetical protein